jgi:hypothetical protein
MTVTLYFSFGRRGLSEIKSAAIYCRLASSPQGSLATVTGMSRQVGAKRRPMTRGLGGRRLSGMTAGNFIERP